MELGISDGPRKGQTVTLRQVTRLVPARAGGTRQIHVLTSRTDLPAGEVCWRMSSRWREENYFRYARTRFALDALDSYAAAPDDPDRMVPNPARKTAPARIRHAEAAAQAAETARDAALLQLRSPAPGQAAYLTNQVINPWPPGSRPPGANSTKRTRPQQPSRPGSRSAPSPRTWSAWTPRPSRSPTPSGWPPATPRPP